MADPFNPYAEWLELPREWSEPNLYQLLGLEPFESDPARIAKAAETASNKVRSFRPGPNARAWSKLLDELLLAKGKLLDADRKREYDEELRETSNDPSAHSLHDTPRPAPASSAGGSGIQKRQFNPMFPPGMGPNVGLSGPEPVEAPKPVSRPKERPVAASSPATDGAGSMSNFLSPLFEEGGNRQPPPAQVSTSNYLATPAEESVRQAPALAPVSIASATTTPTAAVPMAAWPASMLYPQPGYAQPGQLPQGQPQPGQTPMAAPMYAQPMVPQQLPPGYQPTMPGYGMPQQGYQPYAQPMNPYGQPAYGQPQYPGSAYAPPVAMPSAEPPLPASYGGMNAYPHAAMPPGMHAPDPMAPVALPASLPSANIPTATLPAAATATAIPTGKAVSPAARAQAAGGEPTRPQQPIGGPAVAPVQLAANSARSVTMAATNEKRAADSMLFYGTAAAIVLLIGAIGFAVMNSGNRNTEIAENSNAHIPSETHPIPVIPVKPDINKPKPAPVVPAKTTPPVITPPVMIPPKVNDPDKTEVQKPVPKTPETPAPEMKPEPKPEPMPVPMPAPMPTPPPMPEMPADVKQTPVELASLSKAMTTVREALSERNFEESGKQLAIADKLAKTPEQLAKLSRLKLLSEYVRQFDRQLKTLLADPNFDTGAELQIGKSTVVNVVERTPETLIIRVSGVNKSYATNSLPEGLAMALINKRLDPNDPAGKLVKAAFYAVSKNRTSETDAKAKDLLEQATREGADAGDLAQVLTDTYDFK